VIINVKSEFHASILNLNEVNYNYNIIPNGIKPIEYKEKSKTDLIFINTSSPDRCLTTLLKVSPKLI
jgi:hypothetical protein